LVGRHLLAKRSEMLFLRLLLFVWGVWAAEVLLLVVVGGRLMVELAALVWVAWTRLLLGLRPKFLLVGEMT
jgi:hypothetical protein